MQLKELRLAKELRQEDVAKQLDISLRTVRYWEADPLIMKVRYVRELAKLYECSESDLLNAIYTCDRKVS